MRVGSSIHCIFIVSRGHVGEGRHALDIYIYIYIYIYRLIVQVGQLFEDVVFCSEVARGSPELLLSWPPVRLTAYFAVPRAQRESLHIYNPRVHSRA